MSISPEARFIDLFKQIGRLPIVHLPEEVELSASAVALLLWVSRSPGCGVLDIAKGLHLSPPTISVGTHRLAKEGWLERCKDPQDRRSRPLYLTAKGEKLIQRVREHRTQMLRIFLSGLTLDEQELLMNLLERAVGAMEESIVGQS